MRSNQARPSQKPGWDQLLSTYVRVIAVEFKIGPHLNNVCVYGLRENNTGRNINGMSTCNLFLT